MCVVCFIVVVNLYNDTSDVAVNHVLFIWEAVSFFCFWLTEVFIDLLTKKRKNWDFLSCWKLNFRVRRLSVFYFSESSENLFSHSEILSEFSFVWNVGCFIYLLGHYLKFKREFKNENVFAILFVKFVLWMFFKRILFLQEMCELWQRESCLNFVYVFRQQEHVVGI